MPLHTTKCEFYLRKILTVNAVMPKYKSTAIDKAEERLHIFR